MRLLDGANKASGDNKPLWADRIILALFRFSLVNRDL